MIRHSLKIFAVPLFADNYSYIIQHNLIGNSLTLVDPANPTVITQCLNQYFSGCQVDHILYTHKHWDHAGGATELIELLKGKHDKIQVYAGGEDAKHIPTVTQPLLDDCQINLSKCKVRVYQVPCHTRGHTIYHLLPQKYGSEGINNCQKYQGPMLTSEGHSILKFDSDQCAFTGDTLFCGGVGRFFQGNAKEMVQNLMKIDKNLSQQCNIFNGHQYTLNNLKWGTIAEPHNTKISEYLKYLQTGQNSKCTLPTTTKQQRQINVFYRAAVLQQNQLKVPKIEYMRILRQAKNENSGDLHKFSKL